MSSWARAARSRYRRTVERDTPLAAAMAEWLSPSSTYNRMTSLIRRISDLGLGIATPKRA